MTLELNTEEKSSCVETWEHIYEVIKLLSKVQYELTKRIITHDQTKLKSPELEYFSKHTNQLKGTTYGSGQYKKTLEEMKPALHHHYSHNRHHPEYFNEGIHGMNLIDIIELACDWLASSKRHADGNVYKSLEINTDRFKLSPQTVALLKNTFDLLSTQTELDKLHSQKDI